MDLSGLEDYLETQQIGFTSILKSTKHIDPEELKRALIKHHAQMIMIAKGKYPIEVTSPGPETPVKPTTGPGSGKGINKRFFNDWSSDDGDAYEPPIKVKTSAGRYSYVSKPHRGFGSSSSSTPVTPKTETPSSSGPQTSPFEGRGRMQPAGASNLFKKNQNYSESPNGYKKYDVIDLSSGPDSDSEFAEAKEAKESESDRVGRDGEVMKGNSTRGVDTARRGRGQASRRGKATTKSTPSTAKKFSFGSKDILDSPSDESDENIPPVAVKKGESSGFQSKQYGKLDAKMGLTASEISIHRKNISAFEKQLSETQDLLKMTNHVLTRKPILEKIRQLQSFIASNKLSLGEGPKKRGQKFKAATVEDASEEEDDSLFVRKAV
ncbi:uncharacterized protein RCO7_01461 [Rhynchosporium graminicola]|uniref:Uncharacterized protein n=1 Tax=Rhynchosporium graminicola TaxID=2792576 RepID=A0A1E1JZF0_9HELO|nr:uncharacterized protein RCO7_01461 [Rhynchosporium commune]